MISYFFLKSMLLSPSFRGSRFFFWPILQGMKTRLNWISRTKNAHFPLKTTKKWFKYSNSNSIFSLQIWGEMTVQIKLTNFDTCSSSLLRWHLSSSHPSLATAASGSCWLRRWRRKVTSSWPWKSPGQVLDWGCCGGWSRQQGRRPQGTKENRKKNK